MKTTPRKDTHRIEKVNSLLQEQVGRILLPYVESLPGIVTVTKAEASRDMRWAKIWISIVDGDDDNTMAVLKKNLYDIQGELNRTMNVKMVPRLQFFLDTSPRYAAHISELIEKIHKNE